MNKYKKISFPIFSIGIALLMGLILLLLNKDQLALYKINDLLTGNFRSKSAFLAFLGNFSVYILAGMAAVIGFKAGIFNIGISGQMMFSGLISYLFITGFDEWYYDYDPVLGPFLIFIISVIAAMVLGLITAVLKIYFNIHEVVSTIMLNWAVLYLYQYVLEVGEDLSKGSLEANGASIFFPVHLWVNLDIKGVLNSPFNIGIFISAFLIIIFWLIFRFTSLGFKIKVSGINFRAAKYAGIKHRNIILLTMLMSSAVAGVAGFVYYFGITRYLPVQFLPLQIGFDGITVALLANTNFIGIIFSSLFVSAVYTQKVVMSGNKEIVETIISVALLSIALGTYFLAKNKTYILQWYQTIVSKRQQKIPYSYHGVNKFCLAVLIFKDNFQLQWYLFLNRLDIRYTFLERRIINFCKNRFKKDQTFYLSNKLLNIILKEEVWKKYWKEYEAVIIIKNNLYKDKILGHKNKEEKLYESNEISKSVKDSVKKLIKMQNQIIRKFYDAEQKNIKIALELQEKKWNEKLVIIDKKMEADKVNKITKKYYAYCRKKLMFLKAQSKIDYDNQQMLLTKIIREGVE